MIGRVGTVFGEEGVNIISAAVGAEAGGDLAVMAMTTDAPVRAATIDRIASWTASTRGARSTSELSARGRRVGWAR